MAQKARRTAASKSAKNESAREPAKKSTKESSKRTTAAVKKNAGKKGAAADKGRRAAANGVAAAPTLPLAANLPAGAQAIQKAPKVARDAAARSAPKPAAEVVVGPTREMHLHRVEDALGAFVATIADAERLHRQLDPAIANEPE